MTDIAEQIMLVTGSTDGIGKLAAQKLARMEATVLVHGRDPAKCEQTVAEIQNKTGNRKTKAYVADFSSLAEVRKLAEQLASDHSALHVLLNNAGVGPGKTSEARRRESRDGFELCLAVNYLAPFLLTHLLLPMLKNGAPSRIVNVGSAAQEPIDFEDLMLENRYDPWQAYAQSKLALTMFTFDLAEHLKGEKIAVNCLHPGSLLDTKMVRESFGSPMGSADSGAQVEVYVATSPQLTDRTGVYFEEMREAKAHEQAYDGAARGRLWRIGEELTAKEGMDHAK